MAIPDRPKFHQQKDYQPQVTTEQLGQMVQGSVNKLLEAIKSGDSERLTNYLSFSSRFHRYSRNNQQLIYEQAPFATRVGSYATWKQEGFQVRKMAEGEHGIKILVPILPAGFRREERKKQIAEEEKKPKTLEWFPTTNFKVGTVFDKSQLTEESQERLPSLFTKIEGDHEETYDRVVQAIKNNGIPFEESLNTRGAMGYSALNGIVVRPDQPIANKVLVALHEFGHSIAHKEWERRNLPSQVKEAHAEAVSYIVGQYLGVENSYSQDYLRGWGVTPELLRRELDVVTSTASQIIIKIDAVSPNGQQDLDEPTSQSI